jgi:hypothetical protein
MLAMVVNDAEGYLNACVVLAFFVGTPPGACSLLQGSPRWAIHGPARRPTEQDRSEGTPSLSEGPNARGKSPWLLGALPSDSL